MNKRKKTGKLKPPTSKQIRKKVKAAKEIVKDLARRIAAIEREHNVEIEIELD